MAEQQNYTDRVIDALHARLPECPPDLLRLYALLVFAKGEQATAEDVHDAWSLSSLPGSPDHRSLIPFADLPPEIAAYDDKYRDVIRAVAADLKGGTDG